MSDTNRHMTHRRSPVSARRALAPMSAPTSAPASRVNALAVDDSRVVWVEYIDGDGTSTWALRVRAR